jgi:hypothetical protein
MQQIEQRLCRDIIDEVLEPTRGFTLALRLIARLHYPNTLQIKEHLDYLISRGHLVQDAEGRFCPSPRGITLENSDW